MKKAPQLDANGKRKFGIRDSVAYAAGDLGCNMSFSLCMALHRFYGWQHAAHGYPAVPDL